MMFLWGGDRIRFMRDAAEYSDYDRLLAARLRPWLRPEDRVCDAGCGLGHLSLAVAPYVAQVDAVDRDEEALEVLRENIAAENVKNVRVICAGVEDLRPERPYDVMIFSMFGSLATILERSGRLVRGRTIIITKYQFSKVLSLGGHERDWFAEDYMAGLKKQGIRFVADTLTLELGQPLRSLDEARTFLELYNFSGRPVTEEELLERVRPSEDPAFPWYLPHERKLGIMMFETDELERRQA